jgi:diadenosine tetraphosphate (Ap4A) HIT family hydrolase
MPVSRRVEVSKHCVICQRQSTESANVVFESANWIARHSQETNILGYLLLEARRHFLDLSEANEHECASFGRVMNELVGAVRHTVKAERVYTITLAEIVPHFHVHIIPRTSAMPRAFRGRGILNYPLSPGADASLVENVCTSLKRRLHGKIASG